MEQAVTMIDSTSQGSSVVRERKRTGWDSGPTGYPPYYSQRTCGRPPSRAGRSGGSADSQGTGAQSKRVRQDVDGARDHGSSGALLAKDGRERTAMTRVRKTKAMNPGSADTSASGQPQLQVLALMLRTPQTTRWQRQKLRIHPLLRLSRVGLSKCGLTISTTIPFSHPTGRKGYEIPALRNEQNIGAEELKPLLFTH